MSSCKAPYRLVNIEIIPFDNQKESMIPLHAQFWISSPILYFRRSSSVKQPSFCIILSQTSQPMEEKSHKATQSETTGQQTPLSILLAWHLCLPRPSFVFLRYRSRLPAFTTRLASPKDNEFPPSQLLPCFSQLTMPCHYLICQRRTVFSNHPYGELWKAQDIGRILLPALETLRGRRSRPSVTWGAWQYWDWPNWERGGADEGGWEEEWEWKEENQLWSGKGGAIEQKSFSTN